MTRDAQLRQLRQALEIGLELARAEVRRLARAEVRRAGPNEEPPYVSAYRQADAIESALALLPAENRALKARPVEAVCPQAPIARIRIGADGEIASASMYTPGLPPETEHDVYLDDGAPPAALTDQRIVAIRDSLLPSQGEAFDCIAFARAILAAAGTP